MEFHEVKNLMDLSKVLGCKHSYLSFFAYVKKDDEKYHEFFISKKGGGTRRILAPIESLKILQKLIADKLLEYYSPRSCVHGYTYGRGAISNASKHVRQRTIARVDIKDFFPSITDRRLIGLFRSCPFNLPLKVAITLAKILTAERVLPQGSPCSPLIANLICRTLDAKVAKLARENRCYFTRYADDFYFSTNNSKFPSSIIYKKDDSFVLGEDLREIFDQERFEVNESKVVILDKSQRQIVTGIVVNEKLNVSRSYVREVRAMLYSWEKFGLEKAQSYWTENCDYRNRPAWESPRFNWVLRGKINHIGSVKGHGDSTFLKLARRLVALDDSFSLNSSAIADAIAEELVIYTEGKTDEIHLSSAISYFHSIGKFTELKLSFAEHSYSEGDEGLKKACQAAAMTPQSKLTIAIFDRDSIKITRDMKGSTKNYKDHGNNVYSLVIAAPPFREEPICIEHYYEDTDLQIRDNLGRRLYQLHEFDDKFGYHKKNSKLYRTNPKKSTLIVDSDVVDIDLKSNVALSKSNFAKNIHDKIKPFDTINFEHFGLIFEEILNIKKEFLATV